VFSFEGEGVANIFPQEAKHTCSRSHQKAQTRLIIAMSDLKRRGGGATYDDGSDKGKGKARSEDDPLSVLDEAGGAEPLDNEGE
jgi:hypothetical protein